MHPFFSFLQKRIPQCTFGLLIAALIVCSGCQTPRTVAVAIPDRMIVPPTRGCLAPGDVVRLSFSGASEFNQIQKVRSDGRISLPMVGEIVAEGKRPGDLQRELATIYKPQLRNSEVVVAVESSSIPVYVSGCVNKPGKVVIDRPTTVLEAVMEAGGFQAGYANPKKVLLLRNTNGRHQPCILDLSAALKGRTMDATYVNAYDVIYVPESLF
ncbi:MAG: polysaccharide biosynthesis/export family protein [Verrucomicrobia bacterium]|nr:polysaccharide biosynthesis/export family protein [Verrucomicrobiota bacterium]